MPSISLKALTASTGNRHDCWNTPINIVSDVLEFFNQNLELDPCSNSLECPNVPAKLLYTQELDGLSKPWDVESVFMNHPYSESKFWIPYAAQQYRCGNAKEIVILTKLDISTKWWRAISNYPWVAINQRLKFGNSKSAAPFQSAIVYLGHNLPKFKEIFQKYGTIYVPYQES